MASARCRSTGGKRIVAATRINVNRLHHWIAGAQPNARLVYAHGWFAKDICSEAVNDKLLALQEMGYVMLVQGKRDGTGRDYIAVRTSRPWPKSAAPKTPLPENQAAREAEAVFG